MFVCYAQSHTHYRHVASFSNNPSILQAKLQAKELQAKDEGRNLSWRCRWRGNCDEDEDDDEDAPSEFIGDCSQLNGATIVADTGYDVNQNIAFTYPCSGGYLRNFAANMNLFDDVRHAINEYGHDMGIDADCANLCDIDNGSYGTTSSSGSGSLADLEDGVGDLFCDEDDGILQDNSAAGFDASDPCACDPGTYIAGCGHCSGVITFNIKTCANTA